MRKIENGLLLAALCSSVLVACGGNEVSPPSSAFVPAGYGLVWNDEFNVDGLPDSNKWGYDTWGNEIGWGNNEKEYYTRANPDNAHVSNGKLFITALNKDTVVNSDLTLHYTSARLVTMERDQPAKGSWTYGFVEVRAKLPCGQGTWPAIWTLGTGGRWPDDGEIDVMEHFDGNSTVIASNVHWGFWPAHYVTSPQVQYISTLCSEFHSYWLKWTADQIVIGVDDADTLYFPKPAGNPTYEDWPFANPQYLLMNLAIGGNGTGNVAVDDNMFPRSMEVDYVRVYQKP